MSLREALRQQWEPYQTYLSYDDLNDRLRPVDESGHTVTHVLPSLGIDADGIVLKGVFFRTSTVAFGSLRAIAGPNADWDLTSALGAFHIRWVLREQDSASGRIQTAWIYITHAPGSDVRSVVQYAGQNREPWITLAKGVIPPLDIKRR